MLQTLKYLLFGTTPSEPTCKRQPGFTGADQETYKQWLQQKTYLNWTPFLFKAYHFNKAGIRPDYKLERIQERGKNGVIFFYDDRIGPQNFRFLYEHLKEKVLQINYRIHAADIRTCRKNDFSETIHKYYLTPRPNCLKESVLCNQLYGTISIDLILIDSQPAFMRIIANAYECGTFSKPLAFEELLAHLLERPACS